MPSLPQSGPVGPVGPTSGPVGPVGDPRNVKAPDALLDFGRALGPDLRNSMQRTRDICSMIRSTSGTPVAKTKGH